MTGLRRTISWTSTEAFLRVLNVRHKDTAKHSLRVSSVAVEIGSAMNIGYKQLTQLYVGTLLHDIGKLAIPDATLNKPAPLTDEEREMLKSHPVVGCSLVGWVEHLSAARYVVLYHHERYDGLGYPLGLKGEDIPLLARICSVADALDAMLTERPYRKKLTILQALMEVRRCKGTQFSPNVVEALQLLDPEKLTRPEHPIISDLGWDFF